jgi:hypothetical protein
MINGKIFANVGNFESRNIAVRSAFLKKLAFDGAAPVRYCGSSSSSLAKPFKFVRGGQIQIPACARKANTYESAREDI